MLTSPHDFFDLIGYEHAELFAELEHVWQALDRLPDYLARWADARLLGEVRPGAVIEGLVHIGRGTIVEPGAYILGPAVIGENCSIRHGAYLRGNVLMADGCVGGHCTELKSSILLPGAKAPHFNYVGDSILGREANLGAGSICANLRLDGREVVVRANGRSIPTGRQKLGAIVGDHAQTACNTVLDPGTLVPKGAAVRAGLSPAASTPRSS